MIQAYREQTDFMLQILSIIEDSRFALKGGTAINLFYQDLPRLSVDIDLTYLPIENRQSTFKSIHDYLRNIEKEGVKRGFKALLIIGLMKKKKLNLS